MNITSFLPSTSTKSQKYNHSSKPQGSPRKEISFLIPQNPEDRKNTFLIFLIPLGIKLDEELQTLYVGPFVGNARFWLIQYYPCENALWPEFPILNDQPKMNVNYK